MNSPRCLQTLVLAVCCAAVGPAQSIDSLSPSAAIVGAPSFSLVVTGTGFTLASVIRWNGAPLDTKFVINTLLGTLVPSSLIQMGEIANITVTDGGKTSNSATFTVFGETDNPWTPILD
jgi:hypothetical protein